MVFFHCHVSFRGGYRLESVILESSKEYEVLQDFSLVSFITSQGLIGAKLLGDYTPRSGQFTISDLPVGHPIDGASLGRLPSEMALDQSSF